MVEIIAIVRPNKTAETKQALLDIGKPGFTCVRVSGRGKQAVVRTFMDGSVITTGLNNKRMFIIEAENDDEQLIVDKLMAVNCTGEHGDGRIFTVDLQSSYSVRRRKGHDNLIYKTRKQRGLTGINPSGSFLSGYLFVSKNK